MTGSFKPSPLASWPWEFLGAHKYFLVAPLAAQIVSKCYYGGESLLQNWCFHVLLISCLRCVLYEVWHVVSRSNFLGKARHAILQAGVDFEQVDREFDWDNYVILQALVAAVAAHTFAGRHIPPWNFRGVLVVVVAHMLLAEPIYYCAHRALHSSEHLFTKYHSLHHASWRPEPSTAGTATFLERLLLTGIMALPICAAFVTSQISVGLVYAYVLVFDFLRFMIHSNVEVVPLCMFDVLPWLRFLMITPSYHTLHHTSQGQVNFCLFLPFYDMLGRTLEKEAFRLHEDLRRKGREEPVPDSVFVPHGVDLTSVLHVSFIGRTFSSVPRDGKLKWWLVPFLPVVFVGGWFTWFWGKAMLIAQYSFHGLTHQTWTMPLFGFQYFLPNASRRINRMIEETILDADRRGVKVITLGALNKNEAMNGGGALFVKKHPELRVRVCHGNTLTTAVILHELPESVKEVFLTGSTSKIGKAIALYLCRKHVRVLMLTASTDRFNAISEEAPKECQQYLVQVTEYKAAQNCKTWIVGKWAGYSAQNLACPGTHFYQFTLPPIRHLRRDCTYSDSAGMKLPAKDVAGVNSCEHTMPRYVVHACHAGGLIHALEGWQHHEVGAVDVEQIEVVWAAALKHGLCMA